MPFINLPRCFTASLLLSLSVHADEEPKKFQISPKEKAYHSQIEASRADFQAFRENLAKQRLTKIEQALAIADYREAQEKDLAPSTKPPSKIATVAWTSRP